MRTGGLDRKKQLMANKEQHTLAVISSPDYGKTWFYEGPFTATV
jgi:hypothetical protein